MHILCLNKVGQVTVREIELPETPKAAQAPRLGDVGATPSTEDKWLVFFAWRTTQTVQAYMSRYL